MIALEDLKERLGIDENIDRYDNMLQDMEEAAVASIAKRSERYIGPEADITEIRDGLGNTYLYLDNPAVGNVVTSIEFRDLLSSAWVLQDLADFIVNGRKIQALTVAGTMPIGRTNVRVIYPAGYEEGTEPPWLVQGVFDLTAQWFRTRVTVTGGEDPTNRAGQNIFERNTVQEAITMLSEVPGL